MSFAAFLAIVLGLNLACAVIAALIAARTGKDPFAWVLVCAVLGPFGLVALAAARSSGQPVVVKQGSPPGRGPKLLLPSDGSEASLSVVDHLLRHYGPDAGVTLVAVLPVERAEGASDDPASPRRREFDADVESHLGQASRRLTAAGFAVTLETAFGDPAAEILRIAREAPFDAILMGRRGRGGVARLLLGSVSDKVVREAEVPVTVVG